MPKSGFDPREEKSRSGFALKLDCFIRPSRKTGSGFDPRKSTLRLIQPNKFHSWPFSFQYKSFIWEHDIYEKIWQIKKIKNVAYF